MKIRLSILISVLVSVSFGGFAQDYDDIYYDSSKSAKKTSTKKSQPTTKIIDSEDIVDNRDVDEYNRRYAYVDTTAYDSISPQNQEDFVYTDRIRRFHNPSVIIETNNPELAEVYYVSTTPSVNLVIGTPSYYWGTPYWYDWYYPYSWRAGWYGPTWYTPWCDWSWSYGWTWGVPHHHHHWYPGHIHHPGHGIVSGGNYRPSNRPGGNSYTGAGSNIGIGRRPATPSSNRNNSTSVSTGTTRRPGVSGSSTGSNQTRRQGNVSSSSSKRNSSNSNYTNSKSNHQSRRSSSYSSGSSSNNGNRGGSSSGGSRGGGRGGRR